MKNLITKKATVCSGRRQWGQWFRAICGASLFVMAMLGGKQLSAQSVPIYTFDAFEKFLKPTSDTIYVINFWATWCGPCVKELPYFEQLNENYKDKKVKVMLVNIDFRSQYEKKVVPFVKSKKLKSQVVMLDTEGKNDFIDKVNPEWSGVIPVTTIIQATSKTNLFYQQEFTYEELETIVKPLIKL